MALDVRFEAVAFDALTSRALHDVLKLRSDVFILEQGITTEADVDGLDPEAEHVIGRDAEGRVVATARLRPGPEGIHVERVVVAAERRDEGVGGALMAFVHTRLAGDGGVMSAQLDVLRWYEAQGWRPVGDVYDEGGVPHCRMVRVPASPASPANEGDR